MSDMNLDEAKGWRPEAGDVLIGTVTEVSRAFSDYTHDYYPLVTVQPEDDDPVTVHAFHTILGNRLKELRPQIGDTIGIKFHGTRPVKNNPKQTVAVYTVKVEGATRTNNVWDSMTQNEVPQTDVPVSDVTTDDIPF